MRLDKYINTNSSILENTLFKKSVYMQPVPLSVRALFRDISQGRAVKKDRLLSHITNSIEMIRYKKELEKKHDNFHKEANLFFSQPMEEILKQS